MYQGSGHFGLGPFLFLAVVLREAFGQYPLP
jgi:hypothetical protein